MLDTDALGRALADHERQLHGVGEPETIPASCLDDVRARYDEIKRLGTDNVGEYVVEMSVAGERRFVITAKGLEALGLHSLADRARRESRARLEARGLLDPGDPRDAIDTFPQLVPDPVDHDDEHDAPAGAGHDVEAERG